MTDESSARPLQTHQPVRRAEQVQERLRRLDRLGHSDMAWRGRIKLIFEVLDGIASGSVEDPAGMAAAVLAGINRNKLLTRNAAIVERSAGGNEEGERKVRALDAQLYPPQVVEDGNSAAFLISNAERLAQQVVLDEEALNYLYKNSSWNHLLRPDWEKAVRTACSIDSIVRTLNGRQLETVADPEAAAGVFGKLKSAADASKGTLLLTFHGAFVIIARRLFAKVYEGGLTLQKGGIGGIPTSDNYRDALFTSLRLLQDGGIILMAPDGPDGRRTARFKVLGATLMAGEGAAFLAHASNCNTAWYTVVREGNRFVPIIEPGPSRNGGETLNEFSERLYRFYAEKIEGMFVGDPCNILLRPRWSTHFKNASKRNNETAWTGARTVQS